jgi:hypothetical protein
MTQGYEQLPPEELEKILAVNEAERIVQGRKGYITKEELENYLSQLFGGVRFIGEEGYVTKEELAQLRRDVKQFLRWLTLMLLVYANISLEGYDIQEGL